MPPKKKLKAPKLDVVLDDPLHGVKRVCGSGTYDPKKSRLVYNACFYRDGACKDTAVVCGKRKSTVVFSTKASASSASAEILPAEWPSILKQHGAEKIHSAIAKLFSAASFSSSSSSSSSSSTSSSTSTGKD